MEGVARLAPIDPERPSAKLTLLANGMKRSHASLIIQLPTGHIPLNKYLFQILKAATPQCHYCKHKEESVHHYLLDSPAWRHERWHSAKKLGRDAKSLSRLLNSRTGIEQVLKFVGSTGRFRKEADK